jgi:predicted phage terminase large subunit-like protein
LDINDPNYWLTPLARLLLGLDYPDHFQEWARLTESEQRLLLIASRDMGKTTFFDRILPISRILRAKKKYEILIVSYSDGQVMKIGGAIKETFDGNPQLKAFSPRSEEDWSKSRMKFKDGSVIDTLTFGSSGRGGHYDLILIDDPVKDFGGMNPDDQSQYLTRALTPMCKPDGQIIVTGTFVYDGDLIDRIEKNKAYTTKKYPCSKVGKDRKLYDPLWPERWGVKELEARRREIELGDDPFGFSKEYLLEKIDPKAQFFKREMFKRYDPLKLPERLSRVGSWDPAISLDGDFNAMMVTGTDEKGKSYLLDATLMKSDDIQALVDEMFRLTVLHELPYWQLEEIGFQKLLKHWVYEKMREEGHHFGIEAVKTHTKSKQARIMALQPRIAAGSLLFHPTAQEEVIAQFLAFPRGQHDDAPDALSFQIEAWDKPKPATVKAPKNSFEWWKEQVPANDSESWYNTLNK